MCRLEYCVFFALSFCWVLSLADAAAVLPALTNNNNTRSHISNNVQPPQILPNVQINKDALKFVGRAKGIDGVMQPGHEANVDNAKNLDSDNSPNANQEEPEREENPRAAPVKNERRIVINAIPMPMEVPGKLQQRPLQVNGRRNGQLKLNELQPPDHLDAVRMEQDGQLNRDYKKEIFFGEHEEIESVDPSEAKQKLTSIFSMADINTDGYIDQHELQQWIEKKVTEHFAQAQKDNERIFTMLDTDQDGFITWDEFHIEFLMAKGHNEEQARRHVADYDIIPLDIVDKDRLIRFKFLWSEADDDPKDNRLTLGEFRCFRHPEQSSVMMTRMVQDIIDNLDRDRDGIIVEEEFVRLPAGHDDMDLHQDDKKWTEERRAEFRKVIDKDRDGRVNRDELKGYVDPQNPNHARLEADSLIRLGDDNSDGRLSLSEVLDNMDIFLGSKMVDTGKNFHDEF